MQPAEIRRVCDFLSRYQIQQINQDTTLLCSSNTNLLVKNYRISSQDTNIRDEILDVLDRHLSFDSQYVCPLIHFDVNRSQAEGEDIVRAIYQVDKITLKQEIARRRVEGSQFTEEQIWILVSSLVNSLIYLQERGVMYGVLSNSKIFVEDKIRLMDPSSFNINSMAISRLSLHSPEIAANEPEIDFSQSDVYLLALCIIEATTLSEINNQITAKQLSALLTVTAQCYSEELMHVLNFMLKTTANERPTFQNIREFVQQEIQIRQAKLTVCQGLPCDLEDEPSDKAEQCCESQTQNIDILDPDPDKWVMNDWEAARQKYLQSGVKHHKSNLSLTHCDTNGLASINNLESILNIEQQIIRNRRQSCVVQEFKLNNTTTVVKSKKMDRLRMIKKRNGQAVNLVSKIVPSHLNKEDSGFTSPQIMDMLKQETSRARQFISAQSYKIKP